MVLYIEIRFSDQYESTKQNTSKLMETEMDIDETKDEWCDLVWFENTSDSLEKIQFLFQNWEKERKKVLILSLSHFDNEVFFIRRFYHRIENAYDLGILIAWNWCNVTFWKTRKISNREKLSWTQINEWKWWGSAKRQGKPDKVIFIAFQ